MDFTNLAKTPVPATKPLVIVHKNCLDGLGAAFAAQTLLGDCEFYFDTYRKSHCVNDYPVMDLIHAERAVYIFDLSYPEPILKLMYARAKSLMLLDHHKSAMDALKHLPYCYFDITKSGAVLAWDYLAPRLPVPKILRYVQDRDLWQNLLPRSAEISEYLMDKIDFDLPGNEQLTQFSALAARWNFYNYFTQGAILLTYKQKAVQKIIRNKFSLTIPILRNGEYISLINIPAVFGPWHLRSDVGAALAALSDNSHQIGLVFTGFNRDNGLVFSARGLPDTTLALDLALKFDGGGHQTAASGHMSLASLQRYLTKNALHLKL